MKILTAFALLYLVVKKLYIMSVSHPDYKQAGRLCVVAQSHSLPSMEASFIASCKSTAPCTRRAHTVTHTLRCPGPARFYSPTHAH